MATTLAIVAVASALLLFGFAFESRMSALEKKRELEYSSVPDMLEELAENLGFDEYESGEGEVVFTRVVSGAPAALTLALSGGQGMDVNSWIVTGCALELSVDAPTSFSVKGRVDEPGAGSIGAHLELPGWLDVRGSDGDACAVLGRDQRELLARLPWSSILVRGSIVFGERFEQRLRVAHFVNRWTHMRRWTERLAASWPMGEALDALALARASSEDEPFSVRWRAARMLLRDHPGSPHAASLLELADELPDALRPVCFLWGDGARDARYEDLSLIFDLEEPAALEELGRQLAERFPWQAYCDPRCPASAREDLVGRALELGPEDPGGALVTLLTGDVRAGVNRLVLYRELREVGWSPSPDERAALALGAVSSVRQELVRELLAREVTAADGPTLAALMQNGHEGDVAPLIARLRGVGAGGQLTLSEDTASGGLSEAERGERGALTLSGEDGA